MISFVKTDGQILPKSVFLMFHTLATTDSSCVFFISFDVVKPVGRVNPILSGGSHVAIKIGRSAEVRVKVELDCNVVGEIVRPYLAYMAYRESVVVFLIFSFISGVLIELLNLEIHSPSFGGPFPS